MARSKTTRSAGGVVIDPRGRVLVVSQRGNSWSLPKGHIESGEKPLAAARREIREETGVVNLAYVRRLGSYSRFRISRKGNGEDRSERKIIAMYLFHSSQRRLQPEDPKHPEARWMAAGKVADLLTHPRDKSFFNRVKKELGL